MKDAFDRRAMLAATIGTAAALASPYCANAAANRRFFERIGRPIGIQLYALGEEAQKDFEGTLERVAEIGFRDIEMPGLMGRQATDIRHAADAAGVRVSSIHIPLSGDFSIGSDVQRIVDVLGILGTKQLVIPMFPVPAGLKILPNEDFASAIARSVVAAGGDMWKNLAQMLNERASALKTSGISLGYHNHSIEFMIVGSRTAFDILATETDPALVHFEADIGWIVSAGLDPIAFFERYKGRCRQAHIKDVKRGFAPNTALKTAPIEVGSGSVDWTRVLPAAYAAGVRDFYFEQEPPFAMARIEAAAKSYAYLAGVVG